MNLRKMILPVIIVAFLGFGAYLTPIIQDYVMIKRLEGSDNRAYYALLWLIKHKGVPAFDIAYDVGSPYIQNRISWIVHDLYVEPSKAYSQEFTLLLNRRLTSEETITILLRGLNAFDQITNSNSSYYIEDAQRDKPLFTKDNISRLLPLLDMKKTKTVTPFWNILQATNDSALLEAIPDSVFLKALADNSKDKFLQLQVLSSLNHKYINHKVRWKYGGAGTNSMPNSLLLALMKSPYSYAQTDGCQQLECNYEAVAVATNDFAYKGSSNLLNGNIIDIKHQYAGPPLRNNHKVEKAMGISTAEVINTLDGIFKKQPDGIFPEGAICGQELLYLLTGKHWVEKRASK